MNSVLSPKGNVERIITYRDGSIEKSILRNRILKQGRIALGKCITNQLDDSFQFYINRMLFGDGGTQGGAKKYVNASRNGLFGVTRMIKPVFGIIDPSVPTQAVFTSVLSFGDATGEIINEMALQMANGDLFSMLTMNDLVKTEEMSITYNWRIHFV